MTILHRGAAQSNPPPAESWPSTDEVDGWVWNPDDPAPFTDDDTRWAASAFGTDGDDAPGPDVGPVDEWAAAESAALDCMERGMLPPDLADWLGKTSLVGHPA